MGSALVIGFAVCEFSSVDASTVITIDVLLASELCSFQFNDNDRIALDANSIQFGPYSKIRTADLKLSTHTSNTALVEGFK